MSLPLVLTSDDVVRAHERVKDALHRTPIHTSASLDLLTGRRLYFKCENLQVKCALERNPEINGVITHSSGNHGLALAWAARQCRVANCVAVVPRGASAAKTATIRAYGARVVECEPNERSQICYELAERFGYAVVEPHNGYDTMAGQGTIGVELLEQVEPLDAIIVSVGGGGLAAGISKYIKSRCPNIKVFCAEPQGKDLAGQLANGVLEDRHARPPLSTIADGCRVPSIGDRCFPVLRECCEHRVFTLTDDEIEKATKLVWQRLKLVVEPSAGLPLAALLKYGEVDELADCRRIALILCGGNLNLDSVKFC